MVDGTADHPLIEFQFGAAFDGLPALKIGVFFGCDRRHNPGAVGEEQGVAHVEENEPGFDHESILTNGCPTRVSLVVISKAQALRSKAHDPMAFAASALLSSFSRGTRAVLAMYSATRAAATMLIGLAMAAVSREPRQDIYNILWAVVFGFATLNILSLATRRMEPGRRRMTFGELMAVMVVVVSVFLLGWEMLSLLHIFPIKLKR